MYNPSEALRKVQFRILRGILDPVEVPSYIFGFERNKSIPVMAEVHTKKRLVISLDIKDFFSSIRQFQVEDMFQILGFDKPEARTLSELCTYKFFVPQGALTSPKISNIVAAMSFGPVIAQFCQARNLHMTIYADDITISAKELPEKREDTYALIREVIDFVTSTLREYGFVVNKEKTKVMFPHQRQWVCGAVVNDRVNMMRKERAVLRAIVHNCQTKGLEGEAVKVGMDVVSFIRKVSGRINWLCQLNPGKGNFLKAQFREVALPILKRNPDVEIPDLAWRSDMETIPGDTEIVISLPTLPSACLPDAPF